MFAVIRTGGKQYKVSKGDVIRVEKMDGDAGKKVKLDDILMVSDGKKSSIGASAVKGAQVEAEVVAQDRDKKIVVFKKKRRQNYRRKAGHRQNVTILKITNIKAA